MALYLTALPGTTAAGIWLFGSHQARIQAHLPRRTAWHLIRPLAAGRNQKVHFLARFSFCLTLSRLLWNSLKVNRNISFFFGYLSQSLNVSKKCTFWSVFLYILSNTLIVHAHNVTQADRISVCPFSIYDTLIDKNYPVRSVMCYRLALL